MILRPEQQHYDRLSCQFHLLPVRIFAIVFLQNSQILKGMEYDEIYENAGRRQWLRVCQLLRRNDCRSTTGRNTGL